MDGDNGKRLYTNGNVSSSLRTSSSNSTTERESKLEGSSESLHNVALPNESIKQCLDVCFVPTESPPIQVMERPNNSSTSGRTDTSPSRWSVDSNESLFSIRMGNDSFSKDVSPRGDVFTAAGAGELSLSEAYLPRLQLHQSEELSNSPAAKGVDEDVNEDVKLAVVEANTEARISIHADSSDPHVPGPHSDQNKTCNEGVSPVMRETSCPMCKSLHCDGMDCCCRWPSCDCCCRWPTCGCCSTNWFAWPSCSSNCLSCCSCCNKCCVSNLFCACCNRETKRARSISSYALMDKGLTSSSKHNP